MKRLLIFALLLGLLLTGCISVDPENPDAYTDPTTEATTVATTETTEPTTEPIECDPYFCTVYLLEETGIYDSGSIKYYYDENYNITRYDCLTIENELHYQVVFSEQNEMGMPCKVTHQWPGDYSYSSTLSYFMDGKIKEEQEDGSNYTGFQYDYDQKGDLIAKREYFDGMLQSVVSYVYDGETLVSVTCEDVEGNLLYDTVVDNGRIEKVNYYNEGYAYSYAYEYDSNGNIIGETYIADGESSPAVQYRYKAVEVPPDRVLCLLQQQSYIINLP